MTRQRLTIRPGSVTPCELVNERGDVLASGTYTHCKNEHFWIAEEERLDARWIQGPPITIALVHAPA